MQPKPLTPEEIEMNQAIHFALVDSVIGEPEPEKQEPDKESD